MRRLFSGPIRKACSGRIRSLTCAVLSLGTAAAVGPAPANGAAAIPRPFPGGPAAHASALHQPKGVSRALLLTIARGESVTPSERIVLLQCPAPGGTHPRSAEACRLLEPVSGDLGGLKISSGASCAHRYQPTTVSASGMWDGQHLWFERTFGNPCELRAYTGAVFNF
ncbi:subtilase-type protease inhibitor [Sphaerisporangium corydalis]|uniref:Subtilase-type protease inhibitor n=1 Tax=Sphaerisporangium corydalis TaxID=1441875 RepID=A0ABV9EIS3_9ACTN|nr:subtilase-type protease inhibitor [Sphaerisporangium corydalis]